MAATEVRLRHLHPAFGSEVVGVDVRGPLDDELKAQLRAAWDARSLLLFRDQDLSEEEQLRFVETFGEISHQFEMPRGFNYVSNVDEDGINPYGALGFHFDHSFLPRPVRGLVLYGIETPPPGRGGETMFANLRMLLERLPAPLRARIQHLRVRHGVPDVSKPGALPGLVEDPASPRSVHPLVYPHPLGYEILYLSRRHVDCILDVPDEESRALIDELASYLSDEEIVYTHPWRPGDLVLWDNLTLQHARRDFDPGLRRHLRRVQIA